MVLFAITLATCSARMGLPDWRPLPEPSLLWVDTLVLLSASIAMQYAADAAGHLLSDTFIFGSFLIGYLTVRMFTTAPWPNASEAFAWVIGGVKIPLILIAVMAMVLITRSGTMAMAVNYAYNRDRVKAAILLLIPAVFGAMFVSLRAFEWSKLIFAEGVRPWGNPLGAAQFGSCFFLITGCHCLHLSVGVL